MATTFYFLISGLLLIYAANAYFMIFACLLNRKHLAEKNEETLKSGLSTLQAADRWPGVTTQIPMFNELAVAERVMRAAAAMEYPDHQIQILDDSTDETREIVDRVARDLIAEGIRIEVIRRDIRTGFKAGALAEGLGQCDTEFVAIFDADFVPTPDFLLHTVPHLVAMPKTA